VARPRPRIRMPRRSCKGRCNRPTAARYRALERKFGVRRGACAKPTAGAGLAARPELLVAIDRVDLAMMCPENYWYWIEVKWRAVADPGSRVLSENKTRCTLASARTIDAWLADPAYSRVEVERALAAVGQRMAAELLATEELVPCELRSDEAGEVESVYGVRGQPQAQEATRRDDR
jgi:hypothetical protein